MKISDPTQAKTFGDWGYLAIHKHFQKMVNHEANVLKDKEPEELHQMRVGMRRLRSAIAGFEIALELPKTAREKNVAKIANILGKLRDLDVLGEALSKNYIPALSKQEKITIKPILTYFKKQRKQALVKVKNTLKSNLYHQLKQGFYDWLETPTYTDIASVTIEHILPDLLLPQVSKLLLHPGWLVGIKIESGEINLANYLAPEIETILHKQDYILHDLRKEAKRTRYNLELFTHFYGEKYRYHLEHIKEIQTILGDIQDCFVLAEFLQAAFELDIDTKLPTLTQLFRDTRYQKWEQWQNLQQHFLDQSIRDNLRFAIQQPNQ